MPIKLSRLVPCSQESRAIFNDNGGAFLDAVLEYLKVEILKQKLTYLSD